MVVEGCVEGTMHYGGGARVQPMAVAEKRSKPWRARDEKFERKA